MDCKLRAKNCGGCPMLATEYAAQLKKKEADVRALLGKYGPVSPIRGMETPYHYRNKVISTFAPAAGGKLTSGIYAARTHKVLPVESCLLQDEVLDKGDAGRPRRRQRLPLPALRRGQGHRPAPPLPAPPGRCHRSGDGGAGHGPAVLPGAKNFVKACWPRPKSGASPSPPSYRTTIPAAPASFWARTKKSSTARLHPRHPLRQDLRLSPRSFYQVNPVQTAVLYGLAIDAAHLTGKEVVLDAYCGIGTIGLTASDKARQVVGVEVNRDAVRDAIGNAKHNGVKNARFFAADATAWIREAADAGQKADVVFMDPPRRVRRPPSSRAWPAWPRSGWSTSAATPRRWPATSLS